MANKISTAEVNGVEYSLFDAETNAELKELSSVAVQSVKIGDIEYKSGTVVELPTYPTTLPASDVSEWAKADTKPSYTYTEVGADASGSAATAESNAKAYADGLAKNYDASGAANTALASAKSYTDTEVAKKATIATTLSGYGITDAVNSSEKGSANGVATLGTDGLVPSSQLPSYVDDVLEYANVSSFPETGESGKIYIDLAENITYRWSGSTYVEISKSLAIGETSSTAYAGDKGKANADAIAELQAKTYTAEDVGAIPAGDVRQIKYITEADYEALAEKRFYNLILNLLII